ncbi:MAG TPA: hypothetical protein VF407_09510 [Polyangiaceae bacterium]
MLFGMTHGEIGLVVFIFCLVYASRLLPRAGDLLGRLIDKEAGDEPGA